MAREKNKPGLPDGADNGAASASAPPSTSGADASAEAVTRATEDAALAATGKATRPLAVLAPPDVTAVSIDGTQYDVDADGLVWIPPQHIAAVAAYWKL